jgi:hypothetical protein
MRPVRIPIVPVAAFTGLALIGNGVDGSLGAGIALVGSATLIILIALLAVGGCEVRARPRTLRHRTYLKVERWRRRRAARARDRHARKQTEVAYLQRRRKRR